MSGIISGYANLTGTQKGNCKYEKNYSNTFTSALRSNACLLRQ